MTCHITILRCLAGAVGSNIELGWKEILVWVNTNHDWDLAREVQNTTVLSQRQILTCSGVGRGLLKEIIDSSREHCPGAPSSRHSFSWQQILICWQKIWFRELWDKDSTGLEDQRTRGWWDQGTRGPDDQETRQPRHKKPRGPEDQRIYAAYMLAYMLAYMPADMQHVSSHKC